MKIYEEPVRGSWKELCLRPSSENPKVKETVSAILDRVRTGGDRALRELSREIEHRELDSILVSEEEICEACSKVSEGVKKAIAAAAENIAKFHRAQMPCAVEVETAPGVKCIQKPVPIGKVGLYIPAGTAPLFSTVLMLAIPARIAGCTSISLCTPPGPSGRISPEVLYAASFCGVGRIYSLGGAQAIAAMAYGTETVEPVYKIFGPGNQYVTCAKQMVSGRSAAIDMPAGPSEVMVIADGTADPAFVAADLLSQAEHGRDSQVMLVTDCRQLADRVSAEVERQVRALPRMEFASCALENSRCVVFADRKDAVDFANEYAPEHLIVSMADAWDTVGRITSAGSVFVGMYTPESAGDYASGTNHTLPTCGWAHSFSGVNLDSFMKKMTIQEITREGLEGLSETITAMAEAEGLDAHANAVKIRLQ